MAIPKFNIPNSCGASPELNNALSKIADLKDSINVNINLDASAAAEALNSKLADVKAGLDGLAPDLPEIPNVNFQSEITSLINNIDRGTVEGLSAYNAKVAQLQADFGEVLKEKGLELDKLISESSTRLGKDVSTATTAIGDAIGDVTGAIGGAIAGSILGIPAQSLRFGFGTAAAGAVVCGMADIFDRSLMQKDARAKNKIHPNY